MSGKLYVCATPIGNLGDVSRRLIDTLNSVPVVAAEDTRVARKLLSALGISRKELVSFHEHNKLRRVPELISRLCEGTDVALITDAGMPAISDPGYELVRAAIDRGLEVTVVPGPSASLTALVLSGLPPCPFTFLGYLPRTKPERRKALEVVSARSETLIFYEAPHRIEQALEDVLDVLGDRQMALARELTKVFEEVRRGKVSDVLETVRKDPPRGEITVVLSGAMERQPRPEFENAIPKARVAYEELTAMGVPPNKAVAVLAKLLNLSRDVLYRALRVNWVEGPQSQSPK